MKLSILSKMYFSQGSEETTLCGLMSIYRTQVTFAFITLSGFPSLPSPFQNEGSFFPRASSSVSFKVDSLPYEHGKARRKVLARKRGRLSGTGGEPSMLPSRNELQTHKGWWRCKIYSPFLSGHTAKLHFPASLVVSMLL